MTYNASSIRQLELIERKQRYRMYRKIQKHFYRFFLSFFECVCAQSNGVTHRSAEGSQLYRSGHTITIFTYRPEKKLKILHDCY